ncbi:MAG: hypothetical protein AABO58_03245 [Acidobacteriota bacterium]
MAQRHSLRCLTVAAVPAGIALALAVLFTPSLLADGGEPTLIHACVKNANGQVRIVSPTDTCLPSEHSLHWPATAAPPPPPPPPASTPGSVMVHGNGYGVGGTAENFVSFGGGVQEYRTPRAGVIQNMRILVRSNTFNGATPVTLVVNGVPTAVTTVIPAGSTANIDVPGSVTIVDGDKIAVVMNRGASSSGFLEFIVSYEIQ